MRKAAMLGLLAAGMGMSISAHATGKGVQVVANEAERRVDITIDGKPFTTYMWPTSLKKPVLYPLIDDQGITVTRGYPLNPLPNERVDHPHHAGMWFNYGNVNGYDFWNNSDAIKPEGRAKMGTIYEKKIVSTKSGADRGELVVDSIWISGDNKELMKDTTKYVFMKKNGERIIDQTTTLTALDRITFNDDKEGVLGIRVASWLESPTEKGGVFMDANGRPTKVDAAPNSTATGVYLTSEGVQGDKVWSTRGRWCTLSGHDPEGHVATIAILDQPKNPGYPTYWHARGYGLFAANPLGRSIFDPKERPFNYSIDKGGTTTFHYRVLIFSKAVTTEEMNKKADEFAAEAK